MSVRAFSPSSVEELRANKACCRFEEPILGHMGSTTSQGPLLWLRAALRTVISHTTKADDVVIDLVCMYLHFTTALLHDHSTKLIGHFYNT